MQIPVLAVALGGVVLTFALAFLGWWVASRVERRRRTARRAARTSRGKPQQDGARGTPPPPGQE